MTDDRRARAQAMVRQLMGDREPPKEKLHPVEEEVIGLASDYAFGDVWSRPGLPLKARSLITLGVLTALYRTDQIRLHVNAALNLGLTPAEIFEAIFHAGTYSGMPNASHARTIAHEVMKKRGMLDAE